MNGDSLLASGVMGADEAFDNDQPDKAEREAEAKRSEQLTAILPNAEAELVNIDAELAKLDTLRDFFATLVALPSDMRGADIRVKLEARREHMNYLIARRNMIVDALAEIGADRDKLGRTPMPFVPYEPVIREIVKTVPAPQLRGWAAIRAGIRDLLRGSRM